MNGSNLKSFWFKMAPFIYMIGFFSLAYVYLHWVSPATHHWVGLAVAFVGFVLWIWAKAQLGTAFSINPQATALVTYGFYSKFRHPIYYFQLVAFSGVILFFLDPLVVLAVAFFFVMQLYRMKQENKVLREKFGDTYAAFERAVWF